MAPRTTSAGGEQKLKVFISYSRRDTDFADGLVAALEACGFEPFVDKHDIAPGEPWEERLGRLIHSADTVVFAISPDAIASQRCAWEVQKAEELGKRLLPIVVKQVEEADTPERLKRLNYVFFTDGQAFGVALAALVKALNMDLDWIREHTRLGELAARWHGRDRAEALLIRGEDVIAAKEWVGRRPKDAPDPTLLQREFIAESEKSETARLDFEQAQRDRARRTRQVILASVVAAVMGFGLAGTAAWQWQLATTNAWLATESGKRADEQRRVAETQRGLAEASRTQADDLRKAAERSATDALESQKRAEAAEMTARVERDKSARALQLYLLDQARQLAGKGDHATATLLALEARGLQTASTAQSIVQSADRELLVAMNGLRESRLIADMGVNPAADNEVSISGDGRRAAVVDARGPSLRLFDLERGELIAKKVLSFKPDTVQYSADGERVVTHEGTGVCPTTGPAQNLQTCGGKAILWNGRTGEVLAEIGNHGVPVTAAGFDTGGSRLMTSAGHKTSVWNATDGRLISEVGWHMATEGRVGWAIHARHILTLTENGDIVVSDLETGREIRSLVVGQQNAGPEQSPVRPGFQRALFTHDGQLVVASDGDLHVWRAASWEYLGRLGSDGPTDGSPADPPTQKSGRAQSSRAKPKLSYLAVAPAGALALAVRYGDGPILLLDREKLDYVAELPAPVGLRGFKFSADGQFLLAGTDEGGLHIWRNSGAKVADLAGHQGGVSDATIIAGGTEVITAGNDGTLRRWLLTPSSTSRVVTEYTNQASMAVFSADGHKLVSASADGLVRTSDIAGTVPSTDIQLGTADNSGSANANSVALSPDGQRIVAALGNGIVQQWSLATGREVSRVTADAREAYFAAISPDGVRIAASGTGDTTRVWDAATMREELVLRTEGGANSVMFSPDGRRLVTAHLRGMITVWDAQSGQQLASMAQSSHSIMLARYSPDGRLIASAGSDGTVRLWEAETGRPVWSRTIAKGEVWSASFSPDSRFLVASTADNEIVILDARTGEPMATLKGHTDAVTWVEFSPDGRQIVSSSKDKTVRIWPVPDGSNLVARAQTELTRCLTPEQRERRYFLDPTPPRWCITLRKWPYHTEAWRKWQAEIDTGKEVPLPTPAAPPLVPIAAGNLR